MKTLITLLMLSLTAPAAFAQGNCVKLDIQKRKIARVKKKISEQQDAIEIVLNKIDTKDYWKEKSFVVIGLGLEAATTAVTISLLRPLKRLPEIVAGSLAVSFASTYYFTIESNKLADLRESLEKKQNELERQQEKLKDAKKNLDALRSYYPNCI